MLDSSAHSRNRSTRRSAGPFKMPPVHTLFAGFVFSFSKILCDWALVARALMLPVAYIKRNAIMYLKMCIARLAVFSL